MISSTKSLTEEPLYLRLAGQLMHRIENGDYPEGSLLPSEHELSTNFRISRQTVRAAIEILRHRGLIESRRGIGTRVLSRTRAVAQTFSATTISDLRDLVQNTVLNIECRSKFTSGPALAVRFGAPLGSKWLYFGCRRTDAKDGTVLAWTDTYINACYADLVGQRGRIETPLFERIEDKEGMQTTRIRQEIRAVVLTDVMARRIEAESGSPALEITRSYYFDDDRLFEVAINTLPANRFHYSTDLLGGKASGAAP